MLAIPFPPLDIIPAHEQQPVYCWEHAVRRIRTEILSLVRYLGGLAEGQRVVLIR